MFAPPPNLTISEWADQYRKLSPESSAQPGQWRTDKAEYLRGIMDAISDPLIHTVTIKSSAQVGKTEIINNTVGYHIHLDPCPMLLIQPTVEMAEAWSKERLGPMLRDTEALADKVSDDKSKGSKNTILNKRFPGGYLAMIGANSPAGLASRPVSKVLCDEIDRWPVSAGTEGDPIGLAEARQKTFWNRKKVLVSTPTVKGRSRIDTAHAEGDQRKFYVPCPHCEQPQVLKWSQVQWPEHQPEDAHYYCEHCGAAWTDAQRWAAIRKGYWYSERPCQGIASFHLNEIYSPWVRLSEMARNFLKAKKSPETLQTFINTSLGEVWEEDGETVDEDALKNRRETYAAQVPMGAVLLTAGVDVQIDRLEVEVKGWGLGEELWGIDYRVIYGDPDKDDVWRDLDDLLFRTEFLHESGLKMRVLATCIDSGFKSSRVYQYCKPRKSRRVFPTKGMPGEGRPIVTPSKKRTGRERRPVDLFVVGTFELKDMVYKRLKVEEPGPFHFHFPDEYEDDYFAGLTAEKKMIKYSKGFPMVEWIKIGSRNEPLDITVLNFAAFKLLKPNLEAFAARIPRTGPKAKDAPKPTASVRRRRVRSRGIEL